MSQISEQAIRDALLGVVAPEQISGLRLQGAQVGFVLSLPDGVAPDALKAACEEAVLTVAGVEAVTVIVTAHRESPADVKAPAPRKAAQYNTNPLPHVKRVVAVASGKGGVGKSTTTVMLAHALVAQGARVGILDADVMGASIPQMLGLAGAGQPAFENGMMLPPVAHGIRVMSMGLITGDRAAMMRGAMVTKLLAQMLRHVAWGTAEAPLDVLLVDMPPGTGDVHISMVQQVPLNGVLIVTTPQEVALIDARKCVQLFERTQVPRLGVIENMSYFTDPSGMQHHVFGQGGGAALAAEAGMDYWGQVPLLPPLGVAMDAGRKPDALPEVYAIIATRLLAI